MIYLVSGKGGVGKSLVSASLAKSLSEKKRKVLLVELGETSFFHWIYDTEVSFQPSLTPDGFFLSLWDGASCLREYFLHLLKIQRMVDLFFDNRIMQALVDGAPGLKELAIAGKLTSGLRRVGPPMPFDDIVVDGYSTGHFKALIQAPLAMSEAISIGPMGEQSRAIDRILKGQDVRYLVVSTPEELAQTEAEELTTFLKQKFNSRAFEIGNRWWPEAGAERELLPKEFLEKQQSVLELQRQRKVALSLPQLWDADNRKKIAALADHWKDFKI